MELEKEKDALAAALRDFAARPGNYPIYTVIQAAALLDLSPRKVRDMAGDGELKGYKRAGQWYFLPDALQAFVTGGEANSPLHLNRERLDSLQIDLMQDGTVKMWHNAQCIAAIPAKQAREVFDEAYLLGLTRMEGNEPDSTGCIAVSGRYHKLPD